MGKKITKEANNTLEPTTAVVDEKQGDLFTELERKLPPAFTRGDVPKFFGSLVTPGWLANLNSDGLGPKSFKCGKKVAYTSKDFVDWLRAMNGGGAA